MAGIFFITRGHADHVEKWARNMRSQWFPLKTKKKFYDKDTGKTIETDMMINTEGVLRPIQLWEYVIPEEFVVPLCNNLGIPSDETFFSTGPKEKGTGNSFIGGKGIKFHLEALRLALSLQKLPKRDATKGFWHNPIYKDHVNILGIGWKPDEKIKTNLGVHEGV
jgi:hypothetical protein